MTEIDPHSQGDSTEAISRRRLLQLTGVTGASAIMGLSGCAGGGDGGTGDGGTSDDSTGDDGTGDGDDGDGGTGDGGSQDRTNLRIGIPTGPTSMDPHTNTDTPSRNILDHVYDPLVGRNKDLELIPRLATDWRLVNSTTWEFSLREGVSFSNGEPFNSEVVRYNFRRLSGALEGETGVAGQYRNWYSKIESVDTPDEYTARINLSEPDLSFLTRQPLTWMVPKQYVEDNGFEALTTDPVGTGPYTLDTWQKDNRVVLASGDDYFRGTPHFQQLNWIPIPESTTRLLRLTQGEAEVIKDIQPENEQRVTSQSGLEIRKVPGVSTGMIWLNQLDNSEHNLFYENPELRKAVNYGIDVDGVIKTLMGGNGERVNGWAINDQFLGYDSSLQFYPYDPDRAKQLVEEAGYGDGVEATYLIPQGRYLNGVPMVEAFVTQLGEVGFDIEINAVEFGQFVDITLNKEFPEMYTAFYGQSDLSTLNTYNVVLHPSAPFSALPQNNQPSWVQDVVSNIEQAGSMADRQQANGLLQEIERTIHEQAAFGFLFRFKDVFGANEQLQWTPTEDSLMNFYPASWSQS